MRWIALAALTVVSMGGCGDDRDDDIYVHRVDRGHVCTRACNAHYYDRGGQLVVIKGHRHGPNCGHRWNDGRWVVIGTGGGRPVARPIGRPVRPIANRPHVCTRGCSHFYDGKRLVALKGHVHGRNCGHRWDGNRWIILRTGGGGRHVCGRSCNQHYYNGKQLVALKGHRHGANCGHRWDGRNWVIVTNTPTKRRVIRRR